MTILVTGGTGSLGQPTVELLRAGGQDVRVLSRRPGPSHVQGDLKTGAGLDSALESVSTVLHLATAANRSDVIQTRNLLTTSLAASVSHFVYISIVGVDRIPFAYYKAKAECERMIESSGIPFTILRATQFHGFVAGFIRAQRRLPVIVSLDVPDQPIAVEEVAARLAELAVASPRGRVADIGGPEQLRLVDAIATWQRHAGTSQPVWTLRIPGKTIRAFQQGHHMTALPAFGTETFDLYAQREFSHPARDTNEA